MFSSLGIERDLEVFVIMPPSTNFKPEVWIEEDFCFLFLNFASIDLNVAPAASHERISKILRAKNLFFLCITSLLCFVQNVSIKNYYPDQQAKPVSFLFEKDIY